MKQENILARFDKEIASYEARVEEKKRAGMTQSDWDTIAILEHTITALKLLRTQFACRMFPRSLAFLDGRCTGNGFSAHTGETIVGMELPSDHYDFRGPINVYGKTKEQIEAEVEKYL